MKRFKLAKQKFMELSDERRAQIIHRWRGLLPEEVMKLSKREQGKILFYAFYGPDGEQLVSDLIAGRIP